MPLVSETYECPAQMFQFYCQACVHSSQCPFSIQDRVDCAARYASRSESCLSRQLSAGYTDSVRMLKLGCPLLSAWGSLWFVVELGTGKRKGYALDRPPLKLLSGPCKFIMILKTHS
jgi:hypothetical protein